MQKCTGCKKKECVLPGKKRTEGGGGVALVSFFGGMIELSNVIKKVIENKLVLRKKLFLGKYGFACGEPWSSSEPVVFGLSNNRA